MDDNVSIISSVIGITLGVVPFGVVPFEIVSLSVMSLGAGSLKVVLSETMLLGITSSAISLTGGVSLGIILLEGISPSIWVALSNGVVELALSGVPLILLRIIPPTTVALTVKIKSPKNVFGLRSCTNR